MSYYRPGGSGQGSITTEPVQVAEGGTGATTAADARTNLGLGSIATQAASNVAITGGTVTGITDIAVSDGGTGASTAAAARTNLLPSYTGNANKVLSLNGTATDVEWTTNGAGTVTSVDMTVPTGLAVSGNPVTSSGTLAVSLASGYSIPTTAKQTEWDTAYTDRLKWDGGSTGLNASTGRTSLGLGTAATTDATDYAPAAKGVTNGDSHDHSGGDGAQISYNNLSNLPTLGTIASQAANNVSITGGSVTGITDLAVADGGTGASTASGARTNLLPSYTGNGGKVLAVNTGATDVEWISAGGSGTVTSVGMTVPTGLTVSGSPITSSGTLAVTYTAGYSIPTTTSQTNWDTAYTDRLKWDGGSTGLTASTGRTSLGATTLGSNLFTITNPSAVTFPRFNADNTVSSLSAADFRTAIGAGTGSGTVTSVALSGGTTGLTVSGSPVTSSGTITLAGTLAIANGGTGATTLAGANIPVTNSANTFTAAQTFRAANSVRAEAASTQDAVVLAGRAGGTSSYAATLTPTTLTASRTLTLPNATGTVVLDSATQTLTNKTLTDPTIIGAIIEDIFTITDGAAFEIDPGNGSIQLITLGASRTPKATNFANGESVTFMVDDGTAYTLTWTDATFGGSGVVWKTDGGVAPTLNTTGYTVIILWKVGGQVYGARVGDA